MWRVRLHQTPRSLATKLLASVSIKSCLTVEGVERRIARVSRGLVYAAPPLVPVHKTQHCDCRKLIAEYPYPRGGIFLGGVELEQKGQERFWGAENGFSALFLAGVAFLPDSERN